MGPDPLVQHAAHLNEKNSNNSERFFEPLLDEIEANCINLMKQGRECVLTPLEHGEEGKKLEFVAALRDDDNMSIVQTEERTHLKTQTKRGMQLGQKEVEGRYN